MSLFWISTIPLLALAALFVIVPLWRRSQAEYDRSEELRKDANIALFQERSDELESDLAVGNIDQAQFDSLLLELQQNLLADVDVPAAENAQDSIKAKNKNKNKKKKQSEIKEARLGYSFTLPLILALLVPLLAYPLYNLWGYHDDVVVMDLFQATVDNQDNPEESQRLIVSIGQYAQDHPDLPWPFYFLGENFASLGMFEEAQIAYTRASELLEPSAEKALVLGRVATFMYLNGDFQITPEIERVIDEARDINPSEMSILQLLATDAEQRQDLDEAIDYWRLIIQAAPNSEMAQELRIRIAAAQRILAANDPDADSGPTVAVSVSLSSNLELNPNLRVFVAARNAEREGMPPLAAVDTRVSQLPTTIQLDNSSAVGPFNLASAETIYVSALVSMSGTATPSSGDYRIVSDSFALNDEGNTIELVISEQVP